LKYLNKNIFVKSIQVIEHISLCMMQTFNSYKCSVGKKFWKFINFVHYRADYFCCWYAISCSM